MRGVSLRERKKVETAHALSAAALGLAWAKGLDAVTVEAIAEHVDVTARTFFNYFATKEDAVLGVPRTRPPAWTPPPAEPDLSALEQARRHIRTLLSRGEQTAETAMMRRTVQGRHPQLIVRDYMHVMSAGQQMLPWMEGILATEAPSLDVAFRQARAATVLHLLGAAYQLAVSRWTDPDAPSTADALPLLFDRAVDDLLAVAAMEVAPR